MIDNSCFRCHVEFAPDALWDKLHTAQRIKMIDAHERVCTALAQPVRRRPEVSLAYTGSWRRHGMVLRPTVVRRGALLRRAS